MAHTSSSIVNTVVDGTYRQTNLTNESPEYLARREELRLAEIELMRRRERVAELRRNLPQGAPIQDYPSKKAPATSMLAMRLCPPLASASCSPSPIARWSSITSCMARSRPKRVPCVPRGSTVPTALPIISLRILTSPSLRPPSPALRAYARTAGWDRLRLLSAANNTFKYDLGSEDRDGAPDSTFRFSPATPTERSSHLHRASQNGARKFWSAVSTCFAPFGISSTRPEGRGKWYASLDYGTRSSSCLDIVHVGADLDRNDYFLAGLRLAPGPPLALTGDFHSHNSTIAVATEKPRSSFA